jgi:hypothetical protein
VQVIGPIRSLTSLCSSLGFTVYCHDKDILMLVEIGHNTNTSSSKGVIRIVSLYT